METTNYNINETQSLFDISMHAYGIAEYAMFIALENGLSISDTLTAGSSLVLPSLEQNHMVTKSIANRRLIPCTGLTAIEEEMEGIEFWGIEFDFVVQ